MRNLIFIAVAAVAFLAAGIAQPTVTIAQDSVETDWESDRPGTRNRPDSGENIRDRRQDVRDPSQDVSDRRENFRDRGGDRANRRENYQDHRRNRPAHKRDFQDYRGYRRDHRRDFRGQRGFGRDYKRDSRAQRGVRQTPKRYYSSRSDRRDRRFAERQRYRPSGRSGSAGGRDRAHRR